MAKISVIIPTRNGEQSVGQLLATLKQQSVKLSQILIVDSFSEDDTLKICKAFDVDIIQINVRGFNHGGTRNLAALKAAGDILVYMTQDAVLRDRNGIAALISPLEDPLVAAVYGRQIPREDANPVERFARFFNYPSNSMTKGLEDLPTLGIKTFFFSNVCSAVRRSAFENVGGFPDNTIMNEDMFLAARFIQSGYKIIYQADAVVYHSHNYSLFTQFNRYFDIGVFFTRNRWIMDSARSEKEGAKYLKELLAYLIANKQWGWLAYATVETAIRFIGYRTGLLERALPLWIKKRMSYNRNFWNKE